MGNSSGTPGTWVQGLPCFPAPGKTPLAFTHRHYQSPPLFSVAQGMNCDVDSVTGRGNRQAAWARASRAPNQHEPASWGILWGGENRAEGSQGPGGYGLEGGSQDRLSCQAHRHQMLGHPGQWRQQDWARKKQNHFAEWEPTPPGQAREGKERPRGG